MSFYKSLFISALLSLVACGRATTNVPLPSSNGSSIQGCPAQPPGGEALTAHDVSVTGDVLSFKVTHGGGCKQHTYGVCWTETFLESNPVQAELKILHDDEGGDFCKALLTADLAVDLSTLKSAYQSGYQTQSGTVILRLPSQESPRYNF